MAFRNAFDRLKAGNPRLLPKGSHVSQNNVAREAGCAVSALRRNRYPELVAEIQSWLLSHPEAAVINETALSEVLERRTQESVLREQINSLTSQRDLALNLLAEADSKILALTHEIIDLRIKANQDDTGYTWF